MLVEELNQWREVAARVNVERDAKERAVANDGEGNDGISGTDVAVAALPTIRTQPTVDSTEEKSE